MAPGDLSSQVARRELRRDKAAFDRGHRLSFPIAREILAGGSDIGYWLFLVWCEEHNLDPDTGRQIPKAKGLLERLGRLERRGAAWAADPVQGKLTYNRLRSEANRRVRVALDADLPAHRRAGQHPLWERHPAAMQRAISRHDALMDEVLTRHGGRQVKERGEGDSILAVFTSPSAALAAACGLQRALLAEPWPAQAPLRVRVGLHTGEAELRGIGYYGVTVNRTARIRSLGHGGQVLLSQATAELVRGALPDGASLRPLGAHRLKGLAQPETIWQVVHPELPAEFPPLACPAAHPSNLPVALSSFIGREREAALPANRHRPTHAPAKTSDRARPRHHGPARSPRSMSTEGSL